MGRYLALAIIAIQRDEAVASAEAAEAARAALAQEVIDVHERLTRVEGRAEAAEAERDDLRARIDAALWVLRLSSHPHCRRAHDLLSASPRPPNPEPAPCATCRGTGRVVDRRGEGWMDPEWLPCPSCSASPEKPCD